MNTSDDLARQKRDHEEQIFRDHGAEMGHTPRTTALSRTHAAIMASSEADHVRFLSYVSKEPNERGCLEWKGKPSYRGYGAFSVANRAIRPNRMAYFIHHSFLDPNLFVCHKCDNPLCCNPDHLYLGTHDENMRDMREKGRSYYAKLTHCPQGHEYTPENTYYNIKVTNRCCRICRKVNDAKRQAKKKATRAALNPPPTK